MKCCTKLETPKERCPIVFQCHPSNFKVTWDKTSPILTQMGRFWTIGRSQLSNPSDLPCSIYHFLTNSTHLACQNFKCRHLTITETTVKQCSFDFISFTFQQRIAMGLSGFIYISTIFSEVNTHLTHGIPSLSPFPN